MWVEEGRIINVNNKRKLQMSNFSFSRKDYIVLLDAKFSN